jgi:hypothetical protein
VIDLSGIVSPLKCVLYGKKGAESISSSDIILAFEYLRDRCACSQYGTESNSYQGYVKKVLPSLHA